jgi:branched-chain amino acid transport system ATP-binding protein
MIQLEVKNISKRFGGIQAIRDLDFGVKSREILALIGPNGAGKSTVFNCINGFIGPKGSILSRGKPCRVETPPDRPPGNRPHFPEHCPFQQHDRPRQPSPGQKPLPELRNPQGGLFYGKALREELESRRLAEEIIDFLEIERYRKIPVGALPFGVQKGGTGPGSGHEAPDPSPG